MNNLFVRRRLESVTPGTLFRLVNSDRVSMRLSTFDGVQDIHTNTKGSLTQWIDPFKKWTIFSSWIIFVKSEQRHREHILTLLHELFHIILLDQGLDHLSHRQAFSDKILDHAAVQFMIRYPQSVSCLWRQMKK
jgi:hypothetical protein